MLILLVAGISLLAVAFVFLADLATAPARERRAALAHAAGYAGQQATAPPLPPLRERVLDPLLLTLARLALRLTPRTTVDHVRRRLVAAGLGRRLTPTGFLAGKVLVAGGGTVFGLFLATASGKPAIGIFMALAMGVMGLIIPEFVLSRRATSRCEEVAVQLPKAIDLLAVSVEAGLGLDAAITRLIERMEGPLIDEFNLTLGEVRVGESRDKALKNLAERVPAPELADFVRAVVQSEQLGISLGKILKTQAGELRHRRQMKAEEQAMKAPVKMLFPTVLFIFPAMFLVILGPAMLTLGEIFGGGGR